MFLCINHKKICVLFVLLILLPITYAKSQNNNPPQAKIKVIPVESSSDAFTLTFVIHNNLKRENWGIGFFMFHFFLKTQNSLNIEICENNTMRCEKLKVDKKSQNMPLSVGHITLLSPL